MYRIPHGAILVRPDTPESMAGGLHIAVQEERPWGVVVLAGEEEGGGHPITAQIGDRVRYKKYAGEQVDLLLPGSPPVSRCVACNEREDYLSPEARRVCPKRSDPATGEFGAHEFKERPPEVETLLVVRLSDVLVVDPR